MIDDILAKFEEDTAIVLESVSLTRSQDTNYQWKAEVSVYVNDEKVQRVLGERGNFIDGAALGKSPEEAAQAALDSLQKTLWEVAKSRPELPPFVPVCPRCGQPTGDFGPPHRCADQDPPPQPFGLAIKLNNAGVSEQCRICSQWFDMEVGPALFKEDSYEPVCLDCGQKYEPLLAWVLTAYHLNRDGIPF